MISTQQQIIRALPGKERILIMAWKPIRLLSYGFLAGTAVVKTATTIKENCDDIAADAKAINEKRAAEARAREIADAKALLAEAEGA